MTTEVIDANLLGHEGEHYSAKLECGSSIVVLALECVTESPTKGSTRTAYWKSSRKFELSLYLILKQLKVTIIRATVVAFEKFQFDFPFYGIRATVAVYSATAVFLAVIIRFLAVSAVTNITTDEHALLSLKASITTSWSSSTTHICNWTGVICNQHGRVASLNLSNMGLLGTIPPSMGNLSFRRPRQEQFFWRYP
ncbi:hypothetical protein RJ640_022406 [Escallonia rubra]|uniref:Leucine-rich repeat-containing N-terminal plant-type domain-containing protein n=1 Tax=Escallonia rubra TaxID=112253 RepID=A0AA88U6G6_9ASTE|nr:hypothetical protein RJ640_022406 [Escallonia rubra]